jgi:hypothetical protein
MGNMITPYTPPTDASVDSAPKSAPAEPPSYANAIAGSKKAREARANFERQVQQDGMGGATPLAAPLENSKTLMGSTVNPYALTPKQLRAVREDPNAPPMLPPPGAHVKLPSSQQAAEFVRRMAQVRAPTADAAHSTLQNKAMTPALGTGAGAAGAGAAGASGAAEPAAPQAAVPDATEHAAAPHAAGNSHGSSHAGSGHQVTKATLEKDYAAVVVAGAKRDPNAPIDWAIFFKLLALKNSGLIHEFALLKAQEEHLANNVSVESLKLSRDYTETNQDFDRLAALAAFAQSVAQMRNDASMGPTRGMTTSNKFLNPQELDLRSGLENAQMQGPVQDVYRRNFIHEVAGDKDYAGVPLLNDPTGEVSKQIHKPDPTQTRQQYKEVNEKKKNAAAPGKPDSHIMVSFTYTDSQGKQVEQKLQRTLLTEQEIKGLDEPNQSSYRSIIARDLDVKRSEDWGGRLGLIENEINILKSSAKKIEDLDTKNHPELAAKQAKNEATRAQLLARAADLEPQRVSALNVMQEAANIAASSEGRFGDLVKNRAVMEEERLRASTNVKMLEANAAGVDLQGKPISNEDQADAVKKLPVYNQLVANLNYRCLSLDHQLARFIDPQSKSVGPAQGQEVGENRRARWHTGSQSIVRYYRDYKLGTGAADPVAAQAFDARTVPYIRNTLAISEKLNELILKHPGADFSQERPFPPKEMTEMKNFVADHKEDVTPTRMMHHLKDRAMALAENDPERNLVSNAEKFWKNNADLLTSAGSKEFIPKRSVTAPKADLLASPAQWAGQKIDAGRMTWTLRQQRPKEKPAAKTDTTNQPETGPAAASAATPSGSRLLDTGVDYTDPKAVANYHDIQAKAGAAIFGNLSTGKRTGAYKDATYERYERISSALRTYAMNASNANVLNNDAEAAIQGVAGDIKEASNDFASLLARARSETNDLVKRMLQKANASLMR